MDDRHPSGPLPRVSPWSGHDETARTVPPEPLDPLPPPGQRWRDEGPAQYPPAPFEETGGFPGYGDDHAGGYSGAPEMSSGHAPGGGDYPGGPGDQWGYSDREPGAYGDAGQYPGRSAYPPVDGYPDETPGRHSSYAQPDHPRYEEERYPQEPGYAASAPGQPARPGQPGRADQGPRHRGPDDGQDFAGPAERQPRRGHGRQWDDEADGFLATLGRESANARNAPPRPDRARDGAGGGHGSPPKPRRGFLRRAAPWVAVSVVVMMLSIAGAGYFYYYSHYLHPADFTGSGTGSVQVHILPGDSAAQVGQILVNDGVVASVRAFSNAATASGKANSLEPGFYLLHKQMSAALAFQALLNPASRVQDKITFPEGMRQVQILAELGKATGNPQGYKQAMADPSALGLPSYANGNVEGYLFPDTYDVQPGEAPLTVLKMMVAAFNSEAQSVNLVAEARHDQITPGDAIIVASLVQAEGGRLSDFPKIARVIYNRLNQGMKLQLDSTVMYALHTYGIRANSNQLKVNSPYNTYLHTGLPPGPIDSPGAAAISAALHPAPGDWLYFVTVDPKTHETKFTDSFTQFQQFEAELSSNIANGR